jgi:hypothetical protein
MFRWQDPNNNYVNTDGWSATECSSHKTCTQPCPRCVSTNGDGPTTCFSNSTNVNQTYCETNLAGIWKNSVHNGNSRCIFKDKTQSSCHAIGQQNGIDVRFASCEALSRDTCSDGVDPDIKSYMNCEWRDWAACPNQEACEAVGQVCECICKNWFMLNG